MGLLQRLLGIHEGGYSETVWCATNKSNTFIPCLILEEEDDGSLIVRRKSDGALFRVGVRDDRYSPDHGWVTIFYPSESDWLS